MQVVCNEHRNLALEVERGNRSVAYISIDNGEIALRKRESQDFDREFFLEPPIGSSGLICTPRRMARHFLKLKQFSLQGSAASVLVDIMALSPDEPRGSDAAVLVGVDGGFLGAYDTVADAVLVSSFVPGLVVKSVAQMKDWTEGMLAQLKQQVAPKLKTTSRVKLLQGVLAMAKSAAKPAAPAVKTVEKVAKERVAKADGPIAKIKAYLLANQAALRGKSLTRVQVVDALKAMGIKAGTIGVQLGKQLKEMGIEAEKGSRAKAKPAKEPKAPKEAKPAKPDAPAKTKAAKKPAKAKGKK